jgi:hypothetical protein
MMNSAGQQIPVLVAFGATLVGPVVKVTAKLANNSRVIAWTRWPPPCKSSTYIQLNSTYPIATAIARPRISLACFNGDVIKLQRSEITTKMEAATVDIFGDLATVNLLQLIWLQYTP